ncbi:N-acetyltransferase 6-like [Acanthaster planci]|uniref:N-acetyltransferase 6-like n=1 Tax=Acanthaster planci TaxID=133434 RepID=A0A8B8A1T3_ACAPL|nr:N-acetyltransferase 6-like [Acanthaster planci]
MAVMAEQQTKAFSICSLHDRPELIDSCAQLLKITWPCSKPDRLHQLTAEEQSGPPCSLVLIEHGEDTPDTVIGHVRLVTVTHPKTPRGAYLEAVCISPSKHGLGLGRKMLLLAEEYAHETLGCEQMFLICAQSLVGFYERLSYQVYPVLTLETEGANLLSHVDQAATWYGNHPRKNWEWVYLEGPCISKDDLRQQTPSKVKMVKYFTTVK